MHGSAQVTAYLRASFVLVTALVATFVIYVVHASLPFNAVVLPLERTAPIQAVFPEGWRFFTKDPQEPALRAFTRDASGAWKEQVLGSGAQARFAFGFDRSNRMEQAELNGLIQQISRKDMAECKVAPSDCLARIEDSPPVLNTIQEPVLCGEIGVVLQKPVPWAWARSNSHVTMPSQVTKVVVTCSRS